MPAAVPAGVHAAAPAAASAPGAPAVAPSGGGSMPRGPFPAVSTCLRRVRIWRDIPLLYVGGVPLSWNPGRGGGGAGHGVGGAGHGFGVDPRSCGPTGLG